MKLDPKEVRDGKRWLVIAGALALSLTIGLYLIDNMLTYSTAEVDKANKLRELRTAQAGLTTYSYINKYEKDLRRDGYPSTSELLEN